MYSLVAQLVEHLKLNQEVPGSFPSWGIMIFFLLTGQPDCQSHLLSLRQSFINYLSSKFAKLKHSLS